MPTPTFQPLGGSPTTQQIQDYIVKLIRDLNYSFENVDNKNITNVAGFLANETEFMSKNGIVGLSSNGSASSSIRIWSGDVKTGTPLFYVTEGGLMVAQNADIRGNINALTGTIGGFTITLTKLSGTGIIEGGTLRTAAPGNNRIEISGNQLKTYNASDQLFGLVLGPSDAGFTYGDVFLYDSGVKVLEFYNNLASQGYTIRPANGAVLGLGGGGATTKGFGNWTFLSPVIASITGNAATATNATHATNADFATTAGSSTSSSSSSSVPWSGVTGTPTTRSGYGISDAQATITGAATTITASNLTVSRALSSDGLGKVAVSPTTSAQLGYLSTTTSDIQTQLDAKTTDISGKTKTQSGSITVVLAAANTQVTQALTFPVAFATTPNMFATIINASNVGVYINVIPFGAGNTGCNFSCTSGVAQTITFNWKAEGN